MTIPTPIHPNPPPLIRVRGSHRAMGQQLGDALKLQIAHSREIACGLIEHTASGFNLTWEGGVIQAQNIYPLPRNATPNMWTRLQELQKDQAYHLGICVC